VRAVGFARFGKVSEGCKCASPPCSNLPPKYPGVEIFGLVMYGLI
jgi:hypothetical protein